MTARETRRSHEIIASETRRSHELIGSETRRSHEIIANKAVADERRRSDERGHKL